MKPKSKPKPSPSIKAIRSAQEKLGWNDAVLAAKSKLSVSFVSLMLSGQRNLSVDSIATMSKALGIKPAALMSTKQRDDLKALQKMAGGK